MNILVLGSGGREHAFTWKIKQSPLTDELYVSPGNAGTAEIAQNISLFQGEFDQAAFENIAAFVLDKQITLLVVGPEAPLVAGIKDYFDSRSDLSHVTVVGPDKAGAELEGSKDYAKDFMNRHQVPTAQSRTFTAEELSEGLAYLETKSLPIVLKADGLAAGKGVIISETYDHARETLKEMLQDKKFGAASEKVVIEDFLQGIELSVFVLTDGKSYKILPEAKDYKRIGEGDTGPNTGGMGAVTPVPFADEAFMEKVRHQVVEPTIQGLVSDEIDYRGFIFIGLMNVNGDPYVIEYNVRMGDPETEVVIPRIESDIVPLLNSLGTQELDQQSMTISSKTATTVVMVAEGYPGAYQKGKPITIKQADSDTSIIFHAGTKPQEGQVLTNGGRVLAVTGLADSINEALSASYEMVGQVTWEGLYYRKDIGQDLLSFKG